MTLSNFDWTDKTSVRWFLLNSSGHEGPYSLGDLRQRYEEGTIHATKVVWAEGLAEPLPIQTILERFEGVEDDDEVPPPLPPDAFDFVAPPTFNPQESFLPTAEEFSENEFTEEDPEPEQEPVAPSKNKARAIVFVSGLAIALIAFGVYQWIVSQEQFSIRRYPKMSLESHELIQQTMKFDGWDKKIFFKEFVSQDLSHIWLVTEGFQTCQVSAQFQSVRERLLTMTEADVSFKTKGVLKDHVVEFTTFDFTNGVRIIPGLYEVLIQAEKCEWDGLAAKMANGFAGPDETYSAKMNVILYSKGAAEFNKVLSELLRRKVEAKDKMLQAEDLFWQDIQQKLQTLKAITRQVTDSFSAFIKKDPRNFQANLKTQVDLYARNFGSALTSMVVENEKYFKSIPEDDLRTFSKGRNYEVYIRTASKDVGSAWMHLIEDMQKVKGRPSAIDIANFSSRIDRTAVQLQEELNAAIVRVAEGQSLPSQNSQR
jgi:hypothetical protein